MSLTTHPPIEDLNIGTFSSMPTPAQIHQQHPVSTAARATITAGRAAVNAVLTRQDERFLVIVGPCSIHDPVAGLDYAQRLQELAQTLSSQLLIVMRVYFEKPRTSTGWKGFINDPELNDSFQIQSGMSKARAFLCAVNELGLPTATEALDPISPQYLGDLITWTAIGARTAESQTHREMASGLSTAVGFKNGTDGNVMTAINGVLSAASPHSFLGVNADGQIAVVKTRGNPLGHLVLRGGPTPNFEPAAVSQAVAAMEHAKLTPNVIIDCSHANSLKSPDKQPQVLAQVVAQRCQGQKAIRGVMLESFIESGNQPLLKDRSQLRYGCSITDGCLDWPTTAHHLKEISMKLATIS